MNNIQWVRRIIPLCFLFVGAAAVALDYGLNKGTMVACFGGAIYGALDFYISGGWK